MTDDFDGEPTEALDSLGFEPAIPVAGGSATATRRSGRSRPARSRNARRSAWRRRLTGVAVLLVGLIGMGSMYAFFSASSGAAGSNDQAAIQAGHDIFQANCITCHGANLQGVEGRGPSLVNVGSAAVYFQVSTGRMPLAQQGAEAYRKYPRFTEQEIEQLGAYVETYGGGPTVPTGDLRDGDLAEGGELFRLNCAQCHSATGRGAPLSAGKFAPTLYDATDTQIYTAMLSGPENMPVFGDNTITPDQKRAIINYIQTLKASANPGGFGIARIGPVNEGLVIWIVGVGILMFVILWIGAKA